MKLGLLAYKVVKPWLALIVTEAHAAHVDHVTLAAIVYQESRGQSSLVSREKNGSCSVGLGMVNVPDCDAGRIAALRDPATNVRVAARTLSATTKWCAKHRADKYCRAGERVFRGGGAVNRYAGRSSSYARVLAPIRAALAPHVRHARARPGQPAKSVAKVTSKRWQKDDERSYRTAGRRGR